MTDAEKTLRVLLGEVLCERGCEPADVTLEEISTAGTNYTSALFLISVSLGNEELKLFAKVANIGQELRAPMHADWLYSTERFVYRTLTNLYNDLQKNLKEEYKFIFPEFYGCSDETGKEAVVLENLLESGYNTYSRFKSMDWDHGRVGVEYLARFHALSFGLDKRDPEEFKKMTEDMIFRIGSEENTPETIDLWINVVERSIQLLSEQHRDAVKKLVFQPNQFAKYNKPTSRAVISHGDYRLSNMMFKGHGPELSVKVVDYQTVYAGCPATDLIYFIFLGSDEEFRRLYYEKIVNHYYKSLEEALKRLSVDTLEVYPREQFDKDMKETLPYAILLGVTVLPVVTVEPESAPKISTGEADLSSFLVKTNDLYAERFRGIINDCARWGVI